MYNGCTIILSRLIISHVPVKEIVYFTTFTNLYGSN